MSKKEIRRVNIYSVTPTEESIDTRIYNFAKICEQLLRDGIIKSDIDLYDADAVKVKAYEIAKNVIETGIGVKKSLKSQTNPELETV